jgi:hypothetical protein
MTPTYKVRLEQRSALAKARKEKYKSFRTNYIGVPESYVLDQMASIVNHAFNETCYLVGSATQGKNYRDVDVRMIMGDDKFKALFGGENYTHNPFWVLLTTSISSWFRERTGLPVDFQIQQMSNANKLWGRKAGGNHIRHPLGLLGKTWIDKENEAPWRNLKW